MNTDHRIWHIGLFKKISKELAECTVCKEEGKQKYTFKLSKASVKTLVTHMGVHVPEYAEKFNSLKESSSNEDNKITSFVKLTSGGNNVISSIKSSF